MKHHLLAHRLVLVGVLITCATYIFRSEEELPARLVTKWVNDVATNYMTRDEWIVSALTMVLLPSLLIAFAGPWSARICPRGWYLPSIADGNAVVREDIERMISHLSLLLANGAALWMTAFHYLIVRANAYTPPLLELMPMILWVASLVGLVFCVAVAQFTWQRKILRDAAHPKK